MLSLLEDEPSPEYDLPSPEVRAIQKLLYESLMKETLTVEMLQKYEQHLDTDIKVLACERCDIPEDFEGRVRGNDISESRLAEHLSLIEAGYCSCQDTDALSKTKVSGFRLIHKMVKTDKNLPFLAFLHEHNCNLNARTLNSGDAAVMIAIGHEQVKTVSFLVDSSVSLNETINGSYPILFAMEVKNIEIFKTLLAAKDINLNCISVNGPFLFNCITQYPEGVHLMLKAGADPEITDRLGHTALVVCARLKRTEMVKVLIQYGADVNKGSLSPLFQSVQRDDLATATVLLEAGADPNYCDRGENKSLITHASYRGSNEMIEQLIKFGGDVNLVSNRMYSAFHVAAWNGHYETIKILRAAGSDLDKQTRDKNTPLALAAHGGHLQIMKLLLSLGCNVNNADRDGDTPLLYAVRNSMEGGVELLLENGADPDLCDNSNASPLWTAVYHEKKDIVKQLLFVNVKMEVYSRGMDRQRWTDQIYYFYDSAKSPLYVAVEKGFHDIAVLLITAGYEAYREKWLFERELLGNEEMAKLVNNLMEHIEIPLSLLSICRNYLRQFFGHDLHQRVEKLNIPKSLKNYLLLK